MQSVVLDARVQKGLRRLREMGLKVHIQSESNNVAYIFVELKSLMALISKQIKYQNKLVDYEAGFIVIKIWRETA